MGTKDQTLAVLGGSGFLGSILVRYFLSQGWEVFSLTRENYSTYVGQGFDVFLNANGNSKRFWANQYPEKDYKLSVESVNKSIQDFKFKSYIHISSSDVYTDHHDPKQTLENLVIDEARLEPYGLHKYLAEQIVKQVPDYLILRLSAMVGPNLKKGPVKDILAAGELYVTANSALQFITTSEVGRVINELIGCAISKEVFNCGGFGSVKISSVAEILKKVLKIRLDAQFQHYEMDVQKLNNLVKLKSSEDYLREFLRDEKETT